MKELEELTNFLVMFLENFFKYKLYKMKDNFKSIRHSFEYWKDHYLTQHTTKIPENELYKAFCNETTYVFRAFLLTLKEYDSILQLNWEDILQKKNYLKTAYQAFQRKILVRFAELEFYSWWWVIPDALKLSKRVFRIIWKQKDEDFELNFQIPLEHSSREKSKDHGEYYTGSEVVNFILDEIGYTQYLIEKKFLDPACGTGNFVITALERYVTDAKNFEFDEFPGVILNYLFSNPHVVGMDSDPYACCICKFRFLLSVRDLVQIMKEKEPEYKIEDIPIYLTDTLLPDEVYHPFPLLKTSHPILKRLKRTVQFDFVVGNPPYIRATRFRKDRKSKGSSKKSKVRDLYREAYPEVATGSFDISILFLSRGLDWLYNEGYLAFIVTNKFFVNDYAKNLRLRLLKKSRILTIVDLTECDVFKNTFIATTIFIIKKRPIIWSLPKFTKVRIYRVKKDSPKLLKKLQKIPESTQSSFFSDEFDFYTKSQGDWLKEHKQVFKIFDDSELKGIISKINGEGYSPKSVFKLYEIGKLKGGIMGFNYHALRPLISNEKTAPQQMKVLASGLIRPFHTLWGKKRIKLFKRKEIRKPPKEYLTPFLQIDEKIISKTLNELYKSRKLLIRSVARELTCYYDSKGEFAHIVAIFALYDLQIPEILQKLTSTDNKEKTLDDFYHYCSGLLNSRLLDFHHKFNYALGRIPKGSFRYTKEMLKQLPLKIPKNQKELQIYRDIVSKSRQLHQLDIESQKYSEQYQTLKKELDDLICRLYDLTEEEQNQVFTRF